MAAQCRGRSMLRPYIMLTDARAPHPDWRRARVPGVAVAGLAVPGSARLSGAPREIARSQARRRRERGASRAGVGRRDEAGGLVSDTKGWGGSHRAEQPPPRSEEHTSELQSPCNLVCRLLLEKK